MSGRGVMESRQRSLPPYVPYRTFTTFVDSLRAGMPSHVDKSVLKSMSGGVQAWLRASLRAMELIDAANVPQDALHKLATVEGAARQRLLRSLFVSTYGFVLSVMDLRAATPAKLEAAFTGTGAKGDTVRKSMAFMLAMAKDAGIELSPFLLERGAMSRRTSPAGSRRPRRPTTDNRNPVETRQLGLATDAPGAASKGRAALLLAKLPDFDPSWNDDLKGKWLAAFEQLIGVRED